MLSFIKDKIKKIYSTVTQQVSSLFSRNVLDDQFLKELSMLLIMADAGVKTTNDIINKLTQDVRDKSITTLDQAKAELESLLVSRVAVDPTVDVTPRVTLMVGINGSGKTTFVAKLASLLKGNGGRVLVVAGDTFRAAATQQLVAWAERVGVAVFVGKDGQDPASVVFDACKKFRDEQFDHLIIDTAGRLQTKINLMHELEKIRRIIEKQLPQESIQTWLTIDSMLGQNSLTQAEVFHEVTKVNGLVLTKLDGTGKGGIVFAISQKLQLPIVYVTYGEGVADIKRFDAQEYVHGLLYE
jgi:fused signal recognition particle receptor